MISYDEARRKIVDEASRNWARGTFCLDDREIVEDDSIFVFNVGAREYVVDGDRSYVGMGAPIPTVDKETGAVAWVPGMLLYGQHPDLQRRPNPDPTLRI